MPENPAMINLSGQIGEVYDLNRMSFGSMKLTMRDAAGKVIDQADDFEIEGIPELDKECKGYLDEYDRICADYLGKIQARLPITVGDEQYFKFVR